MNFSKLLSASKGKKEGAPDRSGQSDHVTRGTKRSAPKETTKRTKTNVQSPKEAAAEGLFMPKMMRTPPVVHNVRVGILKAMYTALIERNHDKAFARNKAAEIEHSIASDSTEVTYKVHARHYLMRLKRGELDPTYMALQKEVEAAKRENKLKRGLEGLVIPVEKLAARYVVEIPDASKLLLFDDPSYTFECERCMSPLAYKEFVRTANDADSDLLRCHYHLLRRLYNPEKKKLDPTFPCCGGAMGDHGCRTATTHVLKLKEPEKMHKAIPFRLVKDTPGSRDLFAVAFDCEMAFTTKGLELVRVSVVNWDDDKVLMDRMVRPFGQILDLNTRFSGVSDIEEGTTVDGIHLPTIDFEAAQAEFAQLVGSKTILVGHGLENDMNAMRLVHDRIVDTAMLYPRHSTRTHSLKQLAWQYLSRTIQTGEHDSYEDAITAMDIIKADIMSLAKG